MLKTVWLSALMALAVLPARAEEYWVVSSYREPFTNVDALRAKGHTVRVLVVDLHEQFTATLSAVGNAATRGQSRAARERYAQDLAKQIDMQAAGRALKTDIAVRRMMKRLGVREVPVLIRYVPGDVRAAYGGLEALTLAKQLGGAR